MAVSSSKSTSPQGCTNLKLKQASRLVARHYDQALAPTGLLKTQYSLLTAVVKHGPLRKSDLARLLALDVSTVSRNLQPLIDRGLLHISTGGDARSRLVVATPEGLALRTQAQQAWKRAQLGLNERLGTARVLALHTLLDDCMQRLNAENPT